MIDGRPAVPVKCCISFLYILNLVKPNKFLSLSSSLSKGDRTCTIKGKNKSRQVHSLRLTNHYSHSLKKRYEIRFGQCKIKYIRNNTKKIIKNAIFSRCVLTIHSFLFTVFFFSGYLLPLLLFYNIYIIVLFHLLSFPLPSFSLSLFTH